MIRVGRSVGPTHYRYFHNTATCGVFGSAAAAASVLSLDAVRTVDALGNAGTQASGLWQCRIEDTMSKQLHLVSQEGGVRADVEQRHAGRRGAVVLVGDHDDREVRVGAQEALVLPAGAARPSAPRARRMEANWCSKPQPGLTDGRDAGEHLGKHPRCSSGCRRCRRCTSRPPPRPLAVQVPRGVYWKMPCLPPEVSQPGTEPLPAPMSDEMTAARMLGNPCGALCNVVMNVGKFRIRLFWAKAMPGESSITNSMSTLRPGAGAKLAGPPFRAGVGGVQFLRRAGAESDARQERASEQEGASRQESPPGTGE